MTAATDTALQVSPLSGWTGALITGVNISAPLADEELAAIRAALHEWKVVFFRDQSLDHAAQIAFGAQFGDVTPGHPYEGDSAPPGFPQIHTVSPAAYDHRYGTKYRKKRSPNGPGWHADVTPLINPPSHSILRAEAVPALRRRHAVRQRRRRLSGTVAVRAHVHRRNFVPNTASAQPFPPTAARRRSATWYAAIRWRRSTRWSGCTPRPREPVLYVNPSLHPGDRRPLATGEPARPRPAVRGDQPARVHGAVQVGAGQRRLLGQPGGVAPRAAGLRARRRRPDTAPHHTGR